jgi:hypothetical protein
VASIGWFLRYRGQANFHHVKFSSRAVNAETKAPELYSYNFEKTVEGGWLAGWLVGTMAQHIENMEET